MENKKKIWKFWSKKMVSKLRKFDIHTNPGDSRCSEGKLVNSLSLQNATWKGNFIMKMSFGCNRNKY